MDFMTASEAVASLRERLEMTREEFAQRIGVSAKMVQRIEGGQQPTTRVLMKFANLAADAGFQSLADLFEATRRTNAEARVRTVRTTQRVRRVALSDLKYWSAYLEQTHWTIVKFLENPSTNPAVSIEYLRNAAWVMEHVREEIEIPIAEPYSSHFFARKEENAELLRHHQSKLAPELQGAKHGKAKKR
jgi:transcriptional regulator with XRE-family HTH domain